MLLARIAEQAISRAVGVSATAGAAGQWVTADGSRLIEGVLAAESRADEVDIELHLVATWPPAPFAELAEQLRDRLAGAASIAGLQDRLGEISVAVDDLVVPGDEVA